jgi:hypothetical protein
MIAGLPSDAGVPMQVTREFDVKTILSKTILKS